MVLTPNQTIAGSVVNAALDGKVALVTGGAKRLGAAIVRRFHSGGAQVVVHYRNSATDARALADELNGLRAGSAAAVACDLLDTPALAGLVDEAVRRFGGLDVLVNNASSFYPTPMGGITERAWADLVGTNFKAPVFLAQAAARELARREGCIVNIVDIHAVYPMKDHLVYSAAKAGLISATRALARELAPRVRVNAVAPGPILWPEDAKWADEALRNRIIQRTLLKRAGEPDDIAKAVVFLVADAPYVTGEILNVDGGNTVVL
jgi:pteridine reductase